jgi:predicted ATPase/DNA-binding CsgD family transcriptional regulator
VHVSSLSSQDLAVAASPPVDRSRKPIQLVSVPDRTSTLLPVPPTSFVGRAREVAVVRAVLERPEVRLLTLTGPGGVGKTRLALRVAEEVATSYAAGARFVPLAPLIESDLVLPTVARVVGAREAGNRSLIDDLRAALGDLTMLLVLDNFEHVAGAAAALVDLLAACPGLTLLVTSRSLLRVSGEHGYTVPPLGAPDANQPSTPEALDTSDAVQLFVERARAVDPAFSLTAENSPHLAAICRRLDGLPLAIELAAARSNLLPPVALLARLERRLPLLTGGPRDQPARMQTLRDAVAWGYDLLSAQEQALVRRLAVFAGGFTLGAAEQMAADEASDADVIDVVSSLVDKSFLDRLDQASTSDAAEPRFGMLETIREFALERLAASGEDDDVRAAHAAYCLRLADRDQRTMAWREMADWFDLLELEHDNLRSALSWFATRGDIGELLRLAGNLAWFWLYRSHRADGRRWLERALKAASDGQVPDGIRAWALHGAALLTRTQNNHAEAERLAEESLRLYRNLGDAWGTAVSLNLLGALARSQGDLASARAAGEEALALFEGLAMARWVARVRAHLGIVAHWQGDPAAEPLLQAALAAHRGLHDQIGSAITLHWLATMAADRNEFDRAAEFERQGLTAASAAGAKEALLDGLAGLAIVAAGLGQTEKAARLLGAVAVHREHMGYAFDRPELERLERTVVTVREALGDEAFAIAETDGRALSLTAAVAEATALEPLSASATPAVSDASARYGLTPRELDVLGLLAQRRTDREIADELFISPKTAGFHVANILGKLSVANRRQAAALALREGLTAIPS